MNRKLSFDEDSYIIKELSVDGKLLTYHAYVVVCAGARGRGLVNEKGENIGVAPAHIVDLKAAIRYLKWNKDVILGDANKIISSGTSAGGALSSLLGGTGNHLDYEKYLLDLGAAPATDDIFAASCYCPITNLEHADMAYEWEFHGINEGHWWKGDFVLTDRQKELSGLLKQDFPAYVNGLQLYVQRPTNDLDKDANLWIGRVILNIGQE